MGEVREGDVPRPSLWQRACGGGEGFSESGASESCTGEAAARVAALGGIMELGEHARTKTRVRRAR